MANDTGIQRFGFTAIAELSHTNHFSQLYSLITIWENLASKSVQDVFGNEFDILEDEDHNASENERYHVFNASHYECIDDVDDR
jgi:hypothetical protein